MAAEKNKAAKSAGATPLLGALLSYMKELTAVFCSDNKHKRHQSQNARLKWVTYACVLYYQSKTEIFLLILHTKQKHIC